MSEFHFFARCVFNPQMFPDSIQIEVCLGAEAPGAVHDEIITVRLTGLYADCTYGLLVSSITGKTLINER